jgi:hypothetical protein
MRLRLGEPDAVPPLPCILRTAEATRWCACHVGSRSAHAGRSRVRYVRVRGYLTPPWLSGHGPAGPNPSGWPLGHASPQLPSVPSRLSPTNPTHTQRAQRGAVASFQGLRGGDHSAMGAPAEEYGPSVSLLRYRHVTVRVDCSRTPAVARAPRAPPHRQTSSTSRCHRPG